MYYQYKGFMSNSLGNYKSPYITKAFRLFVVISAQQNLPLDNDLISDISETEGTMSDILRQTILPIVDKKICEQKLSRTITDSMMCAGGQDVSFYLHIIFWCEPKLFCCVKKLS